MNPKKSLLLASLSALSLSSCALLPTFVGSSKDEASISHQSSSKDIKALDSAASFSKVDGFEPYKKSGILVQDAYLMAKNGNDRFGYAFTVDAGTPMSEPLAFTVAFSGDISEETVASVKPYAINVTTKGGYTNKAADYAAAVVSGKVAFDGSRDSFSVGAGGTVSTSALYKALTIARESYLGLWTGGGTGPVDDTLLAIREIFETAKIMRSCLA